MAEEKNTYKVVIASYLEPDLVERIRRIDPRLDIIYEPELLGTPRYAADHHPPANRTPEQEAHWQALLGQADIIFDFDTSHREDLPDLVPNVRWIQSTSAGIGQLVAAHNYHTRLPHTIFTTASGVHAQPLAEFCIMAMLMFNKGLLRMLEDKEQRRWERYAGTDLAGSTLGIIGVGRVGSEVARISAAFGMHVLGVNADPTPAPLEHLYAPAELHKLLPLCDYLVVATPHTPATEHMLGANEFAALPAGAVFINIGRGPVVDEPALVAALASGHLRAAALDVFEIEPLPTESPLWEMPNVLISPHSASTSDNENARIVDIFCDNLQRFLAGKPLRNVLDPVRMY